MKLSVAIDPIFNIPLAIGLVVGSTLLSAGDVITAHSLIAAQQHTPALWALDFCSVLLMVQYGAAFSRRRASTQEMDTLRQDHRTQLEAMIDRSRKQETAFATRVRELEALRTGVDQKMEQASEIRDQIEMLENRSRGQEELIATRTAELERMRAEMEIVRMEFEAKQGEAAELHNRLEAMQTSPTANPRTFDSETQRLAQQLDALSARVEQHSRQFDAVNMALEYQRAEVQQLRMRLRALKGEAQGKPLAVAPPVWGSIKSNRADYAPQPLDSVTLGEAVPLSHTNSSELMNGTLHDAEDESLPGPESNIPPSEVVSSPPFESFLADKPADHEPADDFIAPEVAMRQPTITQHPTPNQTEGMGEEETAPSSFILHPSSLPSPPPEPESEPDPAPFAWRLRQ